MADSPAVEKPDAPSFTVAVLPDTQHYSRAHPETFAAQTAWIAANRDVEDIEFVIHEGDFVTEPDREQMDRADRAMRTLDENDVPYVLAIGNHDYDDVATRRADTFEEYFPEGRFADRPWWGGSYDGSAYNAYSRFDALGDDYLVLTLELFPREAVLEWAAEVLESHADHRAVLVTHGYLYDDGTPIDVDDRWDRTTYDLDGHNGDELWERFLARRSNVRLVLCGHVLVEGGARRTTADADGVPVHQLLANYQSLEDGGRGYLRLVRFFPEADAVTVETYSPLLDEYRKEEGDRFRIDGGLGDDG